MGLNLLCVILHLVYQCNTTLDLNKHIHVIKNKVDYKYIFHNCFRRFTKYMFS